MDRITIRIYIPKIDLADASVIKKAIEKMLEDIEGVAVELTAFTVRE